MQGNENVQPFNRNAGRAEMKPLGGLTLSREPERDEPDPRMKIVEHVGVHALAHALPFVGVLGMAREISEAGRTEGNPRPEVEVAATDPAAQIDPRLAPMPGARKRRPQAEQTNSYQSAPRPFQG